MTFQLGFEGLITQEESSCEEYEFKSFKVLLLYFITKQIGFLISQVTFFFNK